MCRSPESFAPGLVVQKWTNAPLPDDCSISTADKNSTLEHQRIPTAPCDSCHYRINRRKRLLRKRFIVLSAYSRLARLANRLGPSTRLGGQGSLTRSPISLIAISFSSPTNRTPLRRSPAFESMFTWRHRFKVRRGRHLPTTPRVNGRFRRTIEVTTRGRRRTMDISSPASVLLRAYLKPD